MLKLPVTYTDYNGVEQTEIFYFNLSVAEVAEMELTMAGGLVENLQRIGESGNPGLIIKTFKDILLSSYGVRSEDGRLFRKDPAYTADFVASGAYEVVFTRLITDAVYAADFVKGMMPTNEDANSQHLINAREERKAEPERAIPQVVQQQATNFFGQYDWLHNQLVQQGIEHNFLEETFFKNLPVPQQEALIKDLQGKMPQAGG